jgi:hypothetical protein
METHSSATKRKAVLFFVLIIPLLTELLSGNTSAPVFFNPIVFLFFIVAYSFPALLIRELYLKWKLGVVGLFVLGLAYGIFNEGVAARTILQTGAVVATAPFEHYGVLGFNIPWMIFIVPWHAFFSVVYPVVLVHAIYPLEAEKSWVSRRMFIALGAVAAVMGCFAYFGTERFPPTPFGYLVVCWTVLLVLVAVSQRTTRRPAIVFERDAGGKRVRYICLGLLFACVQFLPFIWSAARVTSLVQIFLVGLPFYFLYRALRKRDEISGRILALIGIGHYSLWAFLMTVIMYVRHSPVLMLGPLVVWGLLAFLVRKLWKGSTV